MKRVYEFVMLNILFFLLLNHKLLRIQKIISRTA